MCTETVKFINTKYPNMQLEVYPEQPALYENGRLRQKGVPGKFVQFKDYQFVTKDPEEIEFLRNCPNFTGINGVICIQEMSSTALVRDKIVDLTNKHGEKKVLRALEAIFEKAEKKKEPEKPQSKTNKKKSEELLDDADLEE